MQSQLEQDERDAIEIAVALSLVTVSEDEARRVQKYSNQHDQGNQISNQNESMFSLPSNLDLPPGGGGSQGGSPRNCSPSNVPSGSISRPRPQAGGEKSSQDYGLLGPPPPAPTRPRPSPSPQPVANNFRKPPPLPSVGPNATSMPFPQLQAPPSTSRRIKQQDNSLVPPSDGNRSRSVPPPIERHRFPQNLSQSNSQQEVPVENNLITLSPPTVRPKKTPFEFDLSSLDPLRNMESSNTDNLVNNVPPKKDVPIRQLQPMQNVWPPSESKKTVINNPTYQLQTNTLTRPRSTNELSKSFERSLWEQSLPRRTSHTTSSTRNSDIDPLSNLYTLPVSHPVPLTPNSTNLRFQAAPDQTSQDAVNVLSTCVSGDLMDFPDVPSISEHDYMSLESFDPLYVMDNTPSPSHDKLNRSTQLFPDPEKRKQSLFMSPMQKLMPMASACVPQSEEERSNIDNEQRQRTESIDELQDPFSYSDLIVSLEKKRAQHAKEQQDKHPEMRKKSVDAGVPVASVEARQERLSRRTSYIAKGQESSYEQLQENRETADEEIAGFCQMVARIKSKYRHDDPLSNMGLVISPMNNLAPKRDMTVKVVVTGQLIPESIAFTPSLNCAVEHITSHVLLSLTENLGCTDVSNYILKVHGLAEYLHNETVLSDYQYVQQCLKLNDDIKLVLQDLKHVPKAFIRTEQDDEHEVFVPKAREIENRATQVTKDKLNILMETFYKEVENFRDRSIQNAGHEKINCKGVTQAVKAIFAVLYKMEFLDVIKAVKRLQVVTQGSRMSLSPASTSDREAFLYTTAEKATVDVQIKTSVTDRTTLVDDLHVALEEVTKAVKCMIELYCRTFHTDFRFESTTDVFKEGKPIGSCLENLIVHIASIHRVPLKMRTNYEEFKVICGLYYGGKKLCPEAVTSVKPTLSEGFQETLIWDEWLQFDITINQLPRESRLCCTLVGVKSVQASTSEGDHKVHNAIGWVAKEIFNHKFELVQGSQLLGLWLGDQANPNGTSLSNTDNPHSILLQVNLPEFDSDVLFPGIPEPMPNRSQSFSSLHPDDQDTIQQILQKDSITRLTPDELELIWEKRHFLYDKPRALTKVIQGAPSWAWWALRDTYTMIQHWAPLSPIEAIELLLAKYPDTFVRNRAVELIAELNDDQLCDILPQLIQALKFESYHTSALAKLLLERAVTNVRIAHQIYWALKEVAEDVRFRKRYELMFGALLSVVGAAMRLEFTKQEELVKMLYAIAEKVKAAKERDGVLQRELGNMWEFYPHKSVRLPLNPGMEIQGVDVKSCSYFNSFTVPLKLVLVNIEPSAEPIYTMFKVGDDLRQDMITMQMISIMDKLWLRDQLDLKMIVFRCQQTGLKRGLVEIVTESDTLRKIQVKHGHGVAGSFKDGTIAEWLQTQNPTELEYEKAVDNFTSSCAGYCIATYVLGICDRHNDNIMVKQTGHMFHIDFAKFLGDAQKFGNIKRDRVPFVLTTDMAYVINGGDKSSQRFQHFVDLCCQAFNIIRQHHNLFLNLFSLMTLSGIPGITADAAKYVQRVLMPEKSDAEATAAFTRMMNKSMESTSTKINFFIHNLAQLKFSGHNEGALLSFIPKTYSINTDGKISNVQVYGFQKRYSPEKYYIYIIKVNREKQKVSNYIFRRYSEFVEFYRKLVLTFPLVELPTLRNQVILGRSHIHTVAETRKAEVQDFLQELLKLAPEIAEHDLVYTFFHPMLRDEQDIDKTNLQKLKEPSAPKVRDPSINGQIKLSLSYSNCTFTIMVMHVKDLGTTSEGEAPDPYVKLYLLPDPSKLTKRKTQISTKTFHPTYNEMLTYRYPLVDIKQRTLQVTVWNYDALKENEFLGAAHIKLDSVDWSQEDVQWYRLQTLHQMVTK